MNPEPTHPPGSPDENDVRDAYRILAALYGGAGDLGDAFRAAAPWDVFSPGYEPDRIARILAALNTLIPAQIAAWKNTTTPAAARRMWKSLLFSDECRACDLRCHTCHTLAGALGYERVGGRRVWRRRPEPRDPAH
ncbi:hypothetical protein I6A60_35975 [Frankia sp. AgB1.9]|uniref:hypothetical protein n=1 Tax=unclassified Frankia TaxID=2632575 RepID=UPI001933D344|nr:MULTISPECIES: hypothetical protein [unclassified Frankia]MBL7487782.1 hypothetical protein [Frankia sp. AgW1.1]MBL7553213.1 hypothetical protein [Frankia sp. AgB1.9]MBL7622942.1 hypothetical protein [Frankia sp. AgB1.8]